MSDFISNKKILLRERKRHADRSVSSTTEVGYPPARSEGGTQGGVPPARSDEGGTRDGVPSHWGNSPLE